MRSETEIREMLESLEKIYEKMPTYDKASFTPIKAQIMTLEYVLEIGNTSCENCLSKIDLFYKLYAQYFDDINFDIRKEIEKLEECEG